MPAFMAGLGMRQGMPRRQFNQQAPGGNQFTNALNAAGDATATGAGGNSTVPGSPVPPKTPTTQEQNYNPYAAAASGGANPWTYNAQTGGYQPNSNAWMPDWMKKKEEPVGPVMKKERQLTDYTPYADTMTGTKQQAIDLLAGEAKKRGITPNWNELEGKYGSRLQNGMVTGSLFNEIMKDAFGKDVDVEDKDATAAAQKAAADKRQAAMAGATSSVGPNNPWMTPGGGYGGYMPTQVYGQSSMADLMQRNPAVQRPMYDEQRPLTPEQQAAQTAKNAQLNTPEAQARMRQLLQQMGQLNLSGMGG